MYILCQFLSANLSFKNEESTCYLELFSNTAKTFRTHKYGKLFQCFLLVLLLFFRNSRSGKDLKCRANFEHRIAGPSQRRKISFSMQFLQKMIGNGWLLPRREITVHVLLHLGSAPLLSFWTRLFQRLGIIRSSIFSLHEAFAKSIIEISSLFDTNTTTVFCFKKKTYGQTLFLPPSNSRSSVPVQDKLDGLPKPARAVTPTAGMLFCDKWDIKGKESRGKDWK